MEFRYFKKEDIQEYKSSRIIYVDGACPSYQQDKDLELSHWVPNDTPAEFLDDTSTAICLNYIQRNPVHEYLYCVNNHLDVDGVLSAFTICHPKAALKADKMLRQAAAMGDFGAYADRKVARFYHFLRQNIDQNDHLDRQQGYESAFEMILEYMENPDSFQDDSFDSQWVHLEKAISRVQDAEIERELVHPRLSVFHSKLDQTEIEFEQVLYKARFDSGLDDSFLPRQIRNYEDFERLKLLAYSSREGHYYDLMLPDYVWAQTPNLWVPAFIERTDSTNKFSILKAKLGDLADRLQQSETNPGKWIGIHSYNPFEGVKGRGFPVVLSFILEDQPAPSSQDVKNIKGVLKDLLFPLLD